MAHQDIGRADAFLQQAVLVEAQQIHIGEMLAMTDASDPQDEPIMTHIEALLACLLGRQGFGLECLVEIGAPGEGRHDPLRQRNAGQQQDRACDKHCPGDLSYRQAAGADHQQLAGLVHGTQGHGDTQ
jgi:hypothetical protein